jgi:hypothetical protein
MVSGKIAERFIYSRKKNQPGFQGYFVLYNSKNRLLRFDSCGFKQSLTAWAGGHSILNWDVNPQLIR